MKRNFSKRWSLAVAFMATFQFAQAQIDMPQASPKANLKTKVGLTDVEVVYSRPGLKGRDKKIFGELIPYGEVWRTGANESSKITFAEQVKINGQELPAGTYALYTIPGADEWTVIFSNKQDLWGDDGYKQSDDALRVKVKPHTIPYPKETFTIDFAEYTLNGANLTITWDNTQVIVPIEAEVESKVMAQINEKINAKEVTPWTYFQAASYYHQNKKDLEQALNWVNSAIQKEEHFVFYNLKSRILGDMKKYKEAIKAAGKTKELAAKANNKDYVKIGEDLAAFYKEKK